MKTYEQIIQEAKRQKARIEELFLDAEYWNGKHPGEEIDVDPDGAMGRAMDALDAMIAKAMAPYRFFWAIEESEIYAAKDVDELYLYLERTGALPFGVELTADTKGKHWDEVEDSTVLPFKGGSMTCREALAIADFPPCMIASAYSE